MIITGFFLDQSTVHGEKFASFLTEIKKVSNFHENVLNFLFHGGMIPFG